MAIDKNSKAYRALINNGYTDEQIQQMYNEVASGQNVQDVVNNTQGSSERITMGPLNANLNYYQYGDDSNPAQQGQRGGMNEKYTGEGVSNTYIDYNPDLRLGDLDPNYLYGEAARQQNRKDAGYIARRNDQIASALYNEGLVSKEDVANWLAQQNEWMNSTEADRLNTIESVWKRLGQIQPKEKPDISKMADELRKESDDLIYGKVTPEEGRAEEGIIANQDVNTAYRIGIESRIADVQALLNMSDSEIAASLITGTTPNGEQAMQDLQRRYPEKYNAVMAERTKLMGQMNVDSIAKGGEITTLADVSNKETTTIKYAVDNATLSVSATQLLQAIDSALDSNDTAQSAKELMQSIEGDMAKLKNRLLNLRKEANTIFKGDASEQMVNAYISNRRQEIQNQLSILEDRWNSANSRYERELAHSEWEEEMRLKQDAQDLEWYKAQNASTTTTNNGNYTVAERNNNPTNMTVGFMQRAGAELGVDYEVSTDSFWSGGRQLYYAKLLGDPLDTTIRILNKAIAAGKNPFNTTSWSYMNSLGMTVAKWNNMTDDERKNFITNQWLPREGGSLQNMSYYVNNPGVTYQSDTSGYGYKGFKYGFDDALVGVFQQFQKSGKLGASSKGYQDILNTYNITEQEFGVQYRNRLKYNQNQGNQAGIDVLDKMAALYLALEKEGRITKDKDGNVVLDKNFLKDQYLGGPIKSALDALKAELKLQKMQKARENGASFGQMTNPEWLMLEKTNELFSNVGFWSSDKDFTNSYMDMLQNIWSATFHDDFNSDSWTQFLNDKKNGRTNINVALLLNSTSGVVGSTSSANDAIDTTFQGQGQSGTGGIPSMSNL